MLEIVSGCSALKMFKVGHVAADLGTASLFQVGADVSELSEQAFVGQEVDILDMVIGFLVAGLLLTGFAGVDTLENAESAEILEVQLEFADCFRAGNELGDLPFLAFFDLLHHILD